MFGLKILDLEDKDAKKEKIKLLEVLLTIGSIVGGLAQEGTSKSNSLGIFIIFSLFYYLFLTARYPTATPDPKKTRMILNSFFAVTTATIAFYFADIIVNLLSTADRFLMTISIMLLIFVSLFCVDDVKISNKTYNSYEYVAK